MSNNAQPKLRRKKRAEKLDGPVTFPRSYNMDDLPEWFLLVWGALRAYCNQKIVFDLDPERFLTTHPESDLLLRTADMLERLKREGQDPTASVILALRKMAKGLREAAKPENVLVPSEFVWVGEKGVNVRILGGRRR